MENKNKLDLIIEKYENGTLTIDEVLNVKDDKENYQKYWIDLDGVNDRKQLFIDTVEKDEKFKLVVESVKDLDDLFIGEEAYSPMKEATKNLSDSDKFIAMAYTACTKGIFHGKSIMECGNGLEAGFKRLAGEEPTEKKEEGPILDLTSNAKSRVGSNKDRNKLYGDNNNYGSANYRISSWHQSNFKAIASTFNLENRITSWDEESSVAGSHKTPIRGSCKGWDLMWKSYIDNFLLGNDVLIGSVEPDNVVFALVKQAECFSELITEKWFGEDDLKKYLGATNLFKKYNEVVSACEILKKFNPKKDLKDDSFVVIMNKDKTLFERKDLFSISKYFTLTVFDRGEFSALELPPYYKSESSSGVSTSYDNRNNKLTGIVSIDKNKIGYSVKAENTMGNIVDINIPSNGKSK